MEIGAVSVAALTATEHIHDEVRELIRRRGIDPVTDHRSTRLLIDEVIAHYEERVPMSSLPPLLDRAGAVRHVFDTLAGFGPLQRFLDDPASRRSGSINPAGCSSPGTAGPS